LAPGSTDNTVKIWNLRNCSCKSNLAGHSSRVDLVAFSPTSTTLASSSADRSVRIWSLSTNSCIHVLQEEIPRHAELLEWINNDRVLAGKNNGYISIWSATNGTCERVIGRRNGYMRSLAGSHDGCKVATGSAIDHVVRIWDIETRDCEHALVANDSPKDTTDCQWLQHNEYTREYKKLKIPWGCQDIMKSRNARVRGVVWSNDDSRILSMCKEFIAIWDIPTRSCIQIIKGCDEIPGDFSHFEMSLLVRDLSGSGNPVGIACDDVMVYNEKACARIENAEGLKFFILKRAAAKKRTQLSA